MRKAVLFVAGLLAGALVVAIRPAEAQITTVRVATGLASPVQVVGVPGDPTRLLVPELGGRIRLVKNGTLEATPFLDLTPQTIMDEAHGLLAVAFHPQYAANGQLFVLYTRRPDRAPRLVRYQRGGSADAADPMSAQTIYAWPRGAEHHTGGWIGFGPDGLLYVSMGDGGGQMDPGNLAQNLNEPWGKMLRLDVASDGFPADPDRHYAVPADNPFAGSAPGLDEIWAYGLRNPWRCSFDRETGDLWIGDVGQGAHEEVDFVKAGTPGGLNFGWKIMEGVACFSPAANCNRTGLALPVKDRPRADARSITGGFVYRGSAIPELRGQYIYADYETLRVWTFRLNAAGAVTEERERTDEMQPRTGGSLRRIVSFGEDAAGELYVVDMTGSVFKIVSSAPVPDGGGGDAPAVVGDASAAGGRAGSGGTGGGAGAGAGGGGGPVAGAGGSAPGAPAAGAGGSAPGALPGSGGASGGSPGTTAPGGRQGAGGSAGAAASGAGGTVGPASGAEAGSGCGCRLGAGQPGALRWGLGLLLLLAWARRRRR